MIPKDQLQKVPGRGFGYALIKYFQTKYPSTRFAQMSQDSNPFVADIEKKHKQIMLKTRIGLIYCKPKQSSPFKMFENSMLSQSLSSLPLLFGFLVHCAES
jgi:hypothetical protein